MTANRVSGPLPIVDVLKQVVSSYPLEGNTRGHKYVSLNYLTGEVNAGSSWNRASLKKITELVKAAIEEIEGTAQEKEKENILQNYAIIVKKFEKKQQGVWSKFFGKESQVKSAKEFINNQFPQSIHYEGLNAKYEKSLKLTEAKTEFLQRLVQAKIITENEAKNFKSFESVGLLVNDKNETLSGNLPRLFLFDKYNKFIEILKEIDSKKQVKVEASGFLKKDSNISGFDEIGKTLVTLGPQRFAEATNVVTVIPDEIEFLKKLDNSLIDAHKS